MDYFCTKAKDMALSKNRIKELAKYKQKKNRDEEGVFVAEGWKLVEELARKFECTTLIVTEKAEAAAKSSGLKAETASDDEMGRITLMKTPREAYAIFKRPDTRIIKIDAKGLTLALDGVQDPGNVGTIIRTADWFGIETVICTKDCAEPYGPKVVQATMGALGRVKVMETDNLSALLKDAAERGVNIYGTLLEGNDITQEELSDDGVIVMGSEGNGLSKEVRECVSQKLRIENWPKGRETSESLNVAVATAIVCAEFRRRTHK